MLSAVMSMRRPIALLALVLLASVTALALAASLPASATVTVTNDSGAVVGQGSVSNGHLTLQFLTGANGFVSITITDGAGGTSTFSAMIDRSGAVIVVDNGTFQDLASFARAEGLASVDVSEAGNLDGGTIDHASSTGQAAKAAHAAQPPQETAHSQAPEHSQGAGLVSGTKQPGGGH